MSDTGRRLLSGGAWVIGGRLAAGLLTVLVTALLSRLLSPEDLGAYFLAFSLMFVLGHAAALGANSFALREIAADRVRGRSGRARRTTHRAICIAGAGGVLACALLSSPPARALAAALFDPVPIAAVAGLVGLWIALQALKHTVQDGLRGWGDLRLYPFLGGALSGLFTAPLFAALLWSGRRTSLETVLVISVSAWAAAAAVGLIALLRRLPAAGGGPAETLPLGRFLREGLPMLGANASALVAAWLGFWILSASSTPAQVAAFGVCVRLVEVGGLPMMAATAVGTPMLAEFWASDRRAALESMLRAVSAVSFASALAFLVLLAALGDPLLRILFGEEYAGLTTVLVLLALARCVAAFVSLARPALMMTGHHVAALSLMGVSTLVLLGAGIALAPTHGAFGMAVAVLCSSLLQAALSRFALSRRLRVRAEPSFHPSMLRAGCQLLGSTLRRR